jgi:predicted O-methyltransferase YrrM
VNTNRDDAFWQALATAARDVLEQGRSLGYGSVMLEIKFADGVPMVVIANRSTAKRYLASNDALQDIARTLNAAQSQQFKGTQQFTVVFADGAIKRVVVDEAQQQSIS